MRNATKRKAKIGLSALAAASFAAWAGTPVAHAVGTQSTFTISTIEAETNVAYSNGNWDVWVLTATRTDTTGANAGIDGIDILINSPANLGIEVQKVGAGTGVNTTFDANVDGGTPMATGVDAGGQPAFGDIVGGTFIGVGQGPYNTDYTNNPQVTQAVNPGTGVNGLVFVNANVGTSTTDPYVSAYLPPHLTGKTGVTLSSAFVNSGNTLDLTNIDNGSVKAIEIDAAEPADPGQEADAGNGGPVPFANIVVPHGTVFTVTGTIGPSSPDLAFNFSTVVGGAIISPPPATLAVLNLASSQLAGSTNVGTAVIVGSNTTGYPAVTVAFGATQKGNLTVDPFSPLNDNELYGIKESGATSISQLISDLNNSLQISNPGALAEAPTGAAGAIFTALGEQVELVFPTGTGPNTNPEFLNWDTTAYAGNGTVVFTQITVLPEPTAIGALVLGGMGLLSRRRKNRKVSL